MSKYLLHRTLTSDGRVVQLVREEEQYCIEIRQRGFVLKAVTNNQAWATDLYYHVWGPDAIGPNGKAVPLDISKELV